MGVERNKKEILYKSILSVSGGLICFGTAKLAFAVDTVYDAYLLWGLFFPILIALSFGAGYALLCAVPGLAIFSPFLTVPSHGWANLVLSFLLLFWILGHGFLSDLRRKKHFPFFVHYLFQICFIILYLLIHKPLVRAVLPWNAFWPTGYAFRFLPDNILQVNAMILLEFTSLILLFANSLITLRPIQKLFWNTPEAGRDDWNIAVLLGTIFGAIAFGLIPSTGTSSSGASFLIVNPFQSSISYMEILLLKLILVFFFGDFLLHIILYRNRMQYLETQWKEQYTRRMEELNTELEEKVQKRTEALQTAYQEMESFGYTVAHELKSPVRGIQMYNQILQEDNGEVLNPDGKEAVREIDSYCSKSLELIQGILEFSKINAKKINRQPVDLSELVLQAWEETILHYHYDPQKFQLELHPLLPIIGDPLLLSQAISNILSNAVKFSSTREQGIVQVWCSEKSREIQYYFRDNGVGFDSKYADNIFSLFNRMHSNEEFEGNGVGLPIIQNIIHKHDGSVHIEAEPDRGCTVTICLPKVTNIVIL